MVNIQVYIFRLLLLLNELDLTSKEAKKRMMEELVKKNLGEYKTKYKYYFIYFKQLSFT